VLAAWGRVVHRRRWAVLALSVPLLGASIAGVLHGGALSSGNSSGSQIEAGRASALINQEQGSGKPAGSSFLLIFSSPHANATDPAFRSEVLAALAPIARDPRVTSVYTAYDAPTPAVAQAWISRDGHESLARVGLRATSATAAAADYAALRAEVHDVDTIDLILQRTPLAVGFVVLATYVVLFLLTGSVVLPLKAVVLNLLSITASFGALVWIFQDGHLSGLLAFTPQSIDPTVPVILFAIVFGMSMDYEVLLVSRIHEEYVRTRDNRRAVAAGLARSGRLITGAAAIMFAVFLAFGLAEVELIKSIGIGLAIAIAIDATIVRAVIVPAAMRLLGDRNWWAPPFLHRPGARGSATARWAGRSEESEVSSR
jgi:putative drug exporter of the RND superfamily